MEWFLLVPLKRDLNKEGVKIQGVGVVSRQGAKEIAEVNVYRI
jgi:hypothetical protein